MDPSNKTIKKTRTIKPRRDVFQVNKKQNKDLQEEEEDTTTIETHDDRDEKCMDRLCT